MLETVYDVARHQGLLLDFFLPPNGRARRYRIGEGLSGSQGHRVEGAIGRNFGQHLRRGPQPGAHAGHAHQRHEGPWVLGAQRSKSRQWLEARRQRPAGRPGRYHLLHRFGLDGGHAGAHQGGVLGLGGRVGRRSWAEVPDQLRYWRQGQPSGEVGHQLAGRRGHSHGLGPGGVVKHVGGQKKGRVVVGIAEGKEGEAGRSLGVKVGWQTGVGRFEGAAGQQARVLGPGLAPHRQRPARAQSPGREVAQPGRGIKARCRRRPHQLPKVRSVH